MFPTDSLLADSCGSCNWYVDSFQRTKEELQTDLERGGVSRYSLDELRRWLEKDWGCAQKICPEELTRGIRDDYEKIKNLIRKLQSPRRIIDKFLR